MVSLIVNGLSVDVAAQDDKPLLWALREDLGLLGPFDERISVEFPTEAHPAYANWFNVLQVRPEEASGPAVWVGRRVLGALGFIATGASSSTLALWHPMRVAGASARQMLLAAGAARLGVPAADLVTGDGFVRHEASGRALSCGALAREAAVLPPPDDPVLKPVGDWRLIGRSQPRVDLPAKVRGDPVFGMDVVLPDMLHASIRHAPVFGAKVARIANESVVRAEPGIFDVTVVDERQVAVVADSWWRAEQAAWRLEIEWTGTEDSAVSSADLSRRLRAALDTDEPYEHLHDGDVTAVLDGNAFSAELLRDSPRHLAVLDRVAEIAGWGGAMAPGRGRGIAIEECYRSVVAQVVEVTVADDGAITVDRVFCAVDVGLVVNPDAVAAQMEGGIVFGVTTALMSAITLEGGAVVESNFHDFPMQRMADAPEVTVAIIDSPLPPGGVGEPGIVPVAAAVANAIHHATGRRLRSLPLAVTETIGERRTRSVLPQTSQTRTSGAFRVTEPTTIFQRKRTT